MSRLIDADKLKHVIHCAYSDDLEILEKIDEQPTVFDVDEVTESLMDRFRIVSNDEDLEWNRAIDYAVKIVKGGGVE